MTHLSVIEVAELYGFNRQTVYKRIAKGELSKNSDGKIDLAEAIRVFGEPANRHKAVTPEIIENTVPTAEIDMLREQVDMLKEQLRLAVERERMSKDREEVAINREQFYQNQIEAMQRLLMPPKPPEPPFPDAPQDTQNTQATEQVDNNQSTVDTELQGRGQEGSTNNDGDKVKKGFWSSFFGG